MTEKQRGTNDVSVIVDCATKVDAERFVGNFRRYAPTITTVSYESEEDVPGGGVTVTLRYAHTCKNRGNHYGDGRRFETGALANVGGELDELVFHGWSPA